MQTKRVSEGRGTLKKSILFLGLPITVAAVALIVFFAGAFDSTLAEDEGAGATAASQQTSGPGGQPAAPDPTAAPKPQPTPMPTPEATMVVEAAPVVMVAPVAVAPLVVASVTVVQDEVAAKVLPEAKFGEVLDQGWVALDLPASQLAETWYTLQVDTETRSITNFFALFNEESQLISSIKIEDYTKGEPLNNAELTLYYEDGSKRMLFFDGQAGTMSMTQHYQQPSGPSMFSPDLRVAMVFYGLELSDETGQVNALMNLDLTGLSVVAVSLKKQPAERIVADMLREIGALVDQVEEQRAS